MIFLLNLIGLIMNFGGSLLMFFANPKVSPPGIFFPNGEDLKELSENKKRTNEFRLGMAVVSAGFLLQFLALLLSFSTNLANY